jgi:dTDP-4-dehydrorhamnose reductase
MHILILGINGMAGHMIYTYFQNRGIDITGFDRTSCDISDDEWKDKIIQLNYDKHIDIIINCIGILRKESDTNKVLAIKINALFPHELAKIATMINSKIIHLSTDCWKDLDTYGRSKRAGELDYNKHLTIRTSIIGPELTTNGTGLFNWFMTQKDTANGFTKHYWDGITTLELAKQIDHFIARNISGIVDLRSSEKVSKYQLLGYIKEVFNKDITIIMQDTEVIDKTEKHPTYTVVKDIKTQIFEMRRWMIQYSPVYTHYIT